MHLQDRSDWQFVLTAFQRIWGYPDFRSPQGEIVQCLLDKQDALVVMPTGGGKSVCFQLPALLSQGLTLVVSPLVALMENQVQELQQRQLPAALLHSELPADQRYQTLQNLAKLRLLYLSTETLLSDPVWQKLCHPDLVINGLILDEAHCLVQWGETFRPAYRRLGAVRPALLKEKPVGTKMAIAVRSC
jgi:ATP-dependent DNA helicase RecQ